MVAVEELFAEVIAEIMHNPLIFAAEVAQFLILVFALRLLAKRILGPMLERRRQQVLEDLAEADHADERVAQANKEAKRIVAEANQKAQERIREAKRQAAAEFEQAVAAVAEEAENIIKQARQTLEQEETEAVSSVHTKLVDLVTVTTRNVLDEALSEQERRDLVEKSVLSSLEELEDVALTE